MNEYKEITNQIISELESLAEPVYREQLRGFFKEEINPIGVRGKLVHEVASKNWQSVKKEPKERIFELCEVLFERRIVETTAIAIDFLWNLRKKLEKSDFAHLENWLDVYVDNWGTCDNLCGRVVGYFIHGNPEFFASLKEWARSDNRWRRRASAVSLIYSIRRGKLVDEAFEIADILIEDPDDMVRKGYGWMLKVVGERDPERVFNYVTSNVARMPRVAFRYAIEKFPPELKKRAMAAK